ncbi:MAG: alpha/beta family hydrolase [Solirubrobacteraceae bacterium]
MTRKIATPHGPAAVRLERGGGRALLLLGHGAGGGIDAPDLRVVAEAALALGFDVGSVLQPYRVAGRRSPAPAHQLDAAWVAVAEALRGDGPLVVGGRSSGARVACRTANDLGAAGVLCLAFPLRTPGRPDRPSRQPELDAPDCPVLVVQGRGDPFGVPRSAAGRREVVRVKGDHGLKADLAAVSAAVGRWLPRVL